MADNFPGPYEVRMFYQVDGLAHTARYNCFASGSPVPGTDPATIDLVQQDAGLVNVMTALSDWVALLRPVYETSSSFDRAELWQYDVGTTNGTFIAAWNIGLAGTTVQPPIYAGQVTMTFRTLEGNIMKVVLLESTAASKAKVPYAVDTIAEWKAIADYVVDPSGWQLGRDTSFPIAYIQRSGGENEALFRRRYRS